MATPTAAPTTLTGPAFDDPELDGQFLRALDTIFVGGADIGECFMTARRIVPGDEASWRAEWRATADAVYAAAEQSLAAGHDISAREGFLRAVTYYRTSGVFLFRPPLDPAFVDAWERQRNAFQRAAPLSEWSIDIVRIPYESTTLEAYFARPAGDGPFRTLVMVGGYDGTKEEMYFAGGVAALRRGYAVLMIDGPGQGGALVEQGLVFRPDWEAVVTPQIDWLLTRPEVDPARIALMGRSWGGYLAPRAATTEHRVAALVADAAQYAPGAGARYLLPDGYRDQFETGDPAMLNAALEEAMAQDRGLRFTLERGMLTHGFATPIEYLRGAAPFTLEGLADRIRCPTLICAAENDSRGGGGKPLYDAIRAPKAYIGFSNEEGAGEHDEAGAAALFSQRVFDWLDETLG
jgi:dienelactone hydrolase